MSSGEPAPRNLVTAEAKRHSERHFAEYATEKLVFRNLSLEDPQLGEQRRVSKKLPGRKRTWRSDRCTSNIPDDAASYSPHK